ncbi:response regulator [Pseudobacteriovorax antillogorgiicola]|uniref:Response regulator receiver domain-containing protein n=1 Tax=Pseudobacteriovorax antillogorgiicola TaxID=1513793 RepID=A0A1Y6BKH7_9BACT|nr:response regulator [Pseudobacteriovorax antillogorgiicola]TCS54696.1 response regulator receiver domain-containing protein [Pseudobacteriovorax antillogorgiicola]SMF16386.1 Response regulator receiver domain-containing protein [Pseudobacteriovorax antillogorgiicola]
MKKILIADDSEEMIDYYKECFAGIDAEFQLKTFKDPTQALECFKKEVFSLIITDIMMPGMNGFELLKKIRELDSFTTVLVVTGYLNAIDDAIILDPHTFVSEKPVAMAELRSLISSLITIDKISNRRRVLIVDDSRAALFVLSNALKKHGFDVIEANCPSDALEKAQRFSEINLIITDYEMPEMNGVELAESFLFERGNPPVIVLSAKLNVKVKDPKKANIKAWVPKPYKIEVILDTIAKVA